MIAFIASNAKLFQFDDLAMSPVASMYDTHEWERVEETPIVRTVIKTEEINENLTVRKAES